MQKKKKKKNTNKKYNSRYVLKIFKKRVVYLLVCFFKTFKRKKAIVRKYLGESSLLHPKPTIFTHL